MRALTGKPGPYLMPLTGLLFLVDSSCAKMIPVPEADYRKTDAARKETYRLTTRDDLVYEFKKFETTDSALVILEVTSYSKNPSLYDASTIKAPVIVPWNDVESLEIIKHDYILSLLVAAVVLGTRSGVKTRTVRWA